MHTFFKHSFCYTLLETAVLTAVPVDLIDFAVAVSLTSIIQLLLYRALEESFTTFACKHAVVVACGFVAAHNTFGRRRCARRCGRSIAFLAVQGRTRLWSICCPGGHRTARGISLEFARRETIFFVLVWFTFR